MNGLPCGVCYGGKLAYQASTDPTTCFSNNLNSGYCAPVPAGENCNDDDKCMTGGVCTENLCQNPIGEPCSENSDCITNVCT